MLPPRRYYSFADAIEHLNGEGLKCTLSDLFHYGATAAFEPIVYFSGSWRFTGEVDSFHRGIYESEDDSGDELLGLMLFQNKGMDGYIYLSDLCSLQIDSDPDDDSDDDNEVNHYSEAVSIEGFLGFRPVNDHKFFHTIERTGSAPIEYALFSPPFTGVIEQHVNMAVPYAEGRPPAEPCITFTGGALTVNDLFISDYEIEILKRGGRREAGEDIFNEFRSARIKPGKNTPDKNEDDPRYKWPQLIRDLIYLNYGDKDMAESPWKNTDELEKDFQSKGLELPSAKTLRRWLKDR